MTYIREIKGRGCVFRIVRVSGTIRKAEIEAVRRAGLDMAIISAENGGLVDDEGDMHMDLSTR
jgi:hypothetical protein